MKTAAKKLLGFLVLLFTLLLAACSQTSVPKEETTLESQLVGGTAASAGAYPWTAQIWHSTSSGLYMECAGVLLDEGWVITAASCVYDGPTTYRVVLGDHRPAVNEGTEQTLDVMEIIRHPRFVPGLADDDLALLELASPATLNARVAVATIADVPAPRTTLRVAGWGSETPDVGVAGMTARLNFIAMSTVRSSNCGFDEALSPLRFCAGSSTVDKRLVWNDLGDPIFFPSTRQVVGIAGLHPASPSRFHQFTKLSPFRAWMDSYMSPPIVFDPCVYSRLCVLPDDIRRVPWDDCWVCDFDLSVLEEFFRIRVTLPDLGINPSEYASVFSFELVNADGKVIASGKGNGQEPMLELATLLPKGNYKLRVTMLDPSVAKLIHSDHQKYAFGFGFSFDK
jgi:elastase-2